jgi:hypothetical protein
MSKICLTYSFRVISSLCPEYSTYIPCIFFPSHLVVCLEYAWIIPLLASVNRPPEAMRLECACTRTTVFFMSRVCNVQRQSGERGCHAGHRPGQGPGQGPNPALQLPRRPVPPGPGQGPLQALRPQPAASGLPVVAPVGQSCLFEFLLGDGVADTPESSSPSSPATEA